MQANLLHPPHRPQQSPIYLQVPLCLSLLLLAACSLTPDQKQKWGATGSFLAGKAARLAGQIVLSAAIDQFDGGTKANFLDSAATGLRSEMTNVITADDLATVIKIWTPNKSHWNELADEAAKVYAAAPGKPADKVESVAMGFNIAAASERQP